MIIPSADDTATRRFLELLFGEPTTGFVEFRFFEPGRKRKAARRPLYLALPLEYERVASEVLPHGGAHTIAVGVAPRWRVPARGAAGRDHDVLQVSCLWAELKNSRMKGGAVEVLRRIRNFPLRPSAVVSSGRGSHVFFSLREPLHGSGLLEWAEVMLGLRVALGGEPCDELSHMVPPPGTTDVEDGAGVTCKVCEEYSSWVRYGLDEVRAAVSAAPSLAITDSTSPAASRDLSAEELRLRGVGAELIEAIITGRAPAQSLGGIAASDDGSGRDFRIASALSAHGFGDDEIKAVFRSHPRGCGSKWARKSDGEKYLDSLLYKLSAGLNAGTRPKPSGGTLDEDDERPAATLPPGYSEHEDGSIWYQPPVPDEGRKAPGPVKVCNSPVRITEILEHVDTGQVSVVVSFDYLGRRVSAPLPRSRMADARQLAGTLSGIGAPINSLNARLVTAYLSAYEHAFAASLPRKRVTSRFGRGRLEGPFFFPGVSPGVEFSPPGAGETSLFRAYSSRRGSLQRWLELLREVEREGLMIPQVAVLAALVPPLQRKLQLPNFILDIHGGSSTGKSTSLKLAASIYGRPTDPDSLVFQWMNTSTAIEQIAAVCGELPVFLDDAQHCPAELKRLVIYMIANGRGKGRGARGGLGETLSWNTVALSTSEEPLHESSPHEGARGRILSVGGQTPPFRAGMSALVHEVEQVVAGNHGHAGEAYVRHLNGWGVTDVGRWFKRHAEIRGELLKNCSSDLMGRVGGYVAAVQVAAELACPLLGLPFQPDVVGPWLALHVDERQREQSAVFRALRALADHYVANVNRFAGDGRYDPAGKTSLQGVSKLGSYVGFLRSTVEAIFKPRKWNVTALLDKLADAGALYATEKGRHTKKVTAGGVKHRMVCVKWSALLPDDTDART
jgi:hypothetical protein